MSHRKSPLEPERLTCVRYYQIARSCKHADGRPCQLGYHCGQHSQGCHYNCGNRYRKLIQGNPGWTAEELEEIQAITRQQAEELQRHAG
jgi:hypothetical protein